MTRRDGKQCSETSKPPQARERRVCGGLDPQAPRPKGGEHMDIALGLLQGVIASLLACVAYDLAKAIARRIRRR